MKKDFLNLRRSRWLLLSLFALFVGVSPAGADEITVHDGTESSYIVPLFGYRSDSYVKMEYVLPASELADMSGGTITGLKYYLKSSESSSYGNANFVVFLKEVNATTVTAFTGYTTEDIVYQGALDATGATLDIPFNKNYSYNGGNLLVGIYNTVKGTAGGWQVAYYYGTTATSGASAYSYSSQSMASASYVYKQSFLPKTTFTYTAPSCKPVKNLNSSNITADAADISWTAGDGVQTQWQIVYSTDVNFDKDAATPIDVNTTSYKLEGLESGTTYYVAVRSYYSAEEQSNWVSTSFKTEKVAVPAMGFVDDFESNKGWDLINGSCPNKWVRGTSTNNGGSYSLYISNDGTSYPTSSYGSYSLVYAAKLFHFEAGDYTISYDWKCNGEGNYDFLRVGLVPASLELSASTTYSDLGSGSTLPTGWTMFLDGGSKLGGSTVWANKSVDFNIAEAGNYQVVFAWRNDGSSGNNPAAIDNLRIIGSAPVIEVGGDVAGTTLAFGTVNEATNKTITITNVGKVAMNNISLSETADADNVFAYTALPKTSLDVNESMDVTVTFSGSSAKEYTGTFRVAADDCDPVDVTVTATYSNTPATMAITLDEVAVNETVAFGTVGKQATKTFKVANDGDQTLNITSIASNNTTDFTVAPANLTVAGHSSETFTVTFVYPNESPVLDVEKTATITVTASNDGVSAKNFAVTGTRIELWSEDFEANAKPSGWDADTNYWTFADGVAKGKYNSYQRNNYLFTPLLVVGDASEKLTFSYTTTAGSVSIPIYYSKDGGDYTVYSGTPTSLANGVSGTFTITGLEAGNYKFRFGNDDYNLDNFEGFKLNADAPALTVDPTTAADFGTKIKAQPAAKTYTITNSGTGTLTGEITSSDTDKFTVSQSSFSLGAGASMTFDVALVFDTNYGAKAATITIHPTNPGLVDVVINATATTADPNVWEEDFESGSVPEGWVANGWTVTNSNYSNNGTFMFAAGSSNTKTAYSPRLYAEKDQVLSFYVGGVDATDFQTVKWSHDRNAAEGDWTLVGEFTSAGTQEFTAPETGYYYFSFQGKYTSVDNFVGFKFSPVEHDATISAQSISATGTQYVEYTATVTVKEMAGKEEELTAKFFIGAEQFGTDVVETVEANGTKTFTVTFTPNAAVSGDAHFTVTNGDINLTSDNVAVNISEALVLDEAVDNSALITDGTKPAVVVKYTKGAGKWGTIALPFQTTPSDLSTLYGTEVKVFEFKANNAGVLNFRSAETLYAGYPYVIYSDAAMGGDVKFFGKTLTSAKADAYGEVTFQAVYAPKTYTAGDSWYGVTPDGEIRPAGEGASIGALRGYLQATAGARLVISIEDVATGITTVLSPKEFEAEGVYNLQGQKVQQAKKGLYIVNGRKVVVR